MKYLLLYSLVILILVSCLQQSSEKREFSVSGTIKGNYEGKVFLYKRESGDWIKLDSTIPDQGLFNFKGYIALPELHYVRFENNSGVISFFAEPAEINISVTIDDLSNAAITGSASHSEYIAVRQQINNYDERMEIVYKKSKIIQENGNSDSLKILDDQYMAIENEMKEFILNNARKNNSSVVSAYYLLSNIYLFDEKDIESVAINFDPVIHKSVYVITLNERVETMKKVKIGQPAVDFTMTDTSGNPVVLSSLFGKYILVDFWASWCGPCRAENPNVVKAYNNYKNKGFDIIGVSFDKDKTKWIEAIKADSLTWHHVSDLNYWGNAAGKLYAINSIPSNVLLDPRGIIISKNLRGEELSNKLEELLGKQP